MVDTQTDEGKLVRLLVVILSGQLLFAEGVARRLQQHIEHLQLEIVNPKQRDAMAQVIALRPSIVILDSTDSTISRQFSLSKLLTAIPSLRVFRLDPRHEQVQVVTSQQHRAAQVRDLAAVIEQSC